MKKISIILSLFFLLTACSGLFNQGTGGPVTRPTNTLEISTGTDGIMMKFLDDSPPEEVFEYMPTIISFSLHNQGVTDITEALYSVAINPGSHLLYNPNQAAGMFNLKGKSPLDTVGEKKIFTISAEARELPTSIESLDERITAHVCYHYKTVAVTDVCVDTDIGQRRAEQKVCTEGTSSVSGGQGAPIALTSVKVQSIPSNLYEDRTDAIITFVLANEGGGDVMLPEESSLLCQGVFPPSVDKARIEAFLSERRLKCNKQEVSFREGEATIVCRTENGIEKIKGNFYAVFRVEVDYGYHQSEFKVISVKSTATAG